MDCLFDYIGLAGCGSTEPASGLFINSLPGISLKSIDSLASTEQDSYIGVWKDVQTRAIKRLELAVFSEISKNLKIKSAKFQTSTRIRRYGSATGGPKSQLSAIKLTTDCRSSYQYQSIGAIKFAQTSTYFELGIFNVDTMELLDTWSGSLFQTSDTYQINKKYYVKNILIQLYVDDNSLFIDTDANQIIHDCGSIAWGYMDNPNSYWEFIQNDNAYGLNILSYSIGCDLHNLLCNNKTLFSLPLWYLCGAEIMMERMVSNRVNFWTMDKKQAEELKAYFDSEAEKAIKLSFNGIQYSDCDCCVECDPIIAIRDARL